MEYERHESGNLVNLFLELTVQDKMSRNSFSSSEQIDWLRANIYDVTTLGNGGMGAVATVGYYNCGSNDRETEAETNCCGRR